MSSKYKISNEILALIPARGGSKGIPRKNIKNLQGVPLLAYSIAVAKLSKKIGRVIISTEDEKIAAIAQRYGAEVPFLRPAEIAGDNSTDYEFVKHTLDWLQENEGEVPCCLVHLRPTTPLRDPALVDEAIESFLGGGLYTSLRSAHKAPESPYKWFQLSGNMEFRPLWARGGDNDSLNAGRQAFPIAYIPDGYVDVLNSEYILRTGKLHGEHIKAYVSPFCTEVDSLAEFEQLQYEIAQKGSPLYDYLQNKYQCS